MSTVTTQRVKPVPLDDQQPLAVRIARATASTSLDSLPSELIDKTKVCLLDLIGCAFESHELPWSRQAVGLAQAAS
jgi:2-methylcitrate dehydratase PrpD